MNFLRDLLYNTGSVRERKNSSATSPPDKSHTVPAKPQNETATPRQELLALLEVNKAYCFKDTEHDCGASDGVVPSVKARAAQLDDEGFYSEEEEIQSPSAFRMGNNIAAFGPQVPLEIELAAPRTPPPRTPPPRTPSPRMHGSPGAHTQQDSDAAGLPELTTPSPKPRKKDHESPVLKAAVNMLSEQLSPPGNKITDRWQLMSDYRNLDARLMRLEAMEAVMRIQIRAMAPSGVDVIQEEDDDSDWEDEEGEDSENQTIRDSQKYLDYSAGTEIVENIEEGNITKADELEASYDDTTQSIDETTIMMSTLLPLGMAPLDSLSSDCISGQYGYGSEGQTVAPEQHCQYPTELDKSADFLRTTLKPGFCDPFDDQDNSSDIIDDQELPSQNLDSQPTSTWSVNTCDESNDLSEQENRKTIGNNKESTHRQYRQPQRGVLSISPFRFPRNDIDYLKENDDSVSSRDCERTELGQAQSIALVTEVPANIAGTLETTVDEDSFQSASERGRQSSNVLQQNNFQWMAMKGSTTHPRCRSVPTFSPACTPQKSSCKSPRSACRRKGLRVRFNEFAEVRVISDSDERYSLYDDGGWTW
ncbi:hypothetical protein V1509DRAFT_633703 [Lipomyces kononenkoae]